MAWTGDAAADLAEYCLLKTGGNPFFARQFLKNLNAEKVLTFDKKARQWKWLPQKAETLGVADDLLDYLAGKISGLPADSGRVLSAAACLGHRFDLTTLSVILDTSRAKAYRHLLPALRAGLVLAESELAPADPTDPGAPAGGFRVPVPARTASNRRPTTGWMPAGKARSVWPPAAGCWPACPGWNGTRVFSK